MMDERRKIIRNGKISLLVTDGKLKTTTIAFQGTLMFLKIFTDSQ